MERKAAAVIQL